MDYNLESAHNHSIYHIAELSQSQYCGCFYCTKTFKVNEISDWIDDDRTALCPHCGIDAVIGDKSGFPIHDKSFLEKMRNKFFQ